MSCRLSPFALFVIRLSLAYLGSFFGAGTLGSWDTFVSLLTKAGVFDEHCAGFPIGKCPDQNYRFQTLYLIGAGFQNCFSIPSGVLFDWAGPRVTGTVGFVGGVLSVLLMFFAIQFRSVDWLLWIAVPLLQLTTNVASWGVFGFVFYYRDYVGLITGIANSSFLLSSMTMYIVAAIFDAGFALQWGVMFLLVLAVAATIVSFPSTLSLSEYQASFERSFDVKPVKHSSLLVLFRQLFRVFGLRPMQTILYIICACLTNIAFSYWVGTVYQFNTFNISNAASDELSRLSAILYAVVGILSSPLTGLLYDKIGLKYYCVVFLLLNAIATVLCWIPNFGVQVFMQVLMYLFYSFWLTLESKTPAVFAPPALFGSYLALANNITGLVQLGVSFLIPAAIGTTLSGRMLYLAPWYGLFGLSMLSLIALIISLLIRPAPESPPEIPKDKRQLEEERPLRPEVDINSTE